jgi:hypothetical protein
MEVISIYARFDGGSQCPFCGDTYGCAASARRVMAACCPAGRTFNALCATCRESFANASLVTRTGSNR